jgi:hypothetical protein
MNKNNSSLSFSDQRRLRNEERRAAKMQKLFLDPERGRSQDERQAEHAEKLDREQRERAEYEAALWNRPPEAHAVSSRVNKFAKIAKKKNRKGKT